MTSPYHLSPPDHGSFHNDHGALTGLVPPIYFDNKGKEVAAPEDGAGLYVLSRRGEVVRAIVPNDHLAFEVGWKRKRGGGCAKFL